MSFECCGAKLIPSGILYRTLRSSSFVSLLSSHSTHTPLPRGLAKYIQIVSSCQLPAGLPNLFSRSQGAAAACRKIKIKREREWDWEFNFFCNHLVYLIQSSAFKWNDPPGTSLINPNSRLLISAFFLYFPTNPSFVRSLASLFFPITPEVAQFPFPCVI